MLLRGAVRTDLDGLREPKVGDLDEDGAVARNEHVGGLDVAVDDTLAVDVLCSVRRVRSNGNGNGNGNGDGDGDE